MRRGRASGQHGLALSAFLCASARFVLGDEHYQLREEYVGEDFFRKWSFFTGKDPTNGIVDFVDYPRAQATGLISASGDKVYMGVDSTSTLFGNQGRPSVKLQSNSVYNNGLFVLTADHVPSACGAWPAWWMFGEDAQHTWPRWGEYDILEAVHKQPFATTTLHTREHCDQRPVNSGLDFDGPAWSKGIGGMAPAKDCNVHAPGEYTNQGCGQQQPDGSFGPGLNQNGGGTWAAEWDPGQKHIRTWFFPKGQEPQDLLERKPLPEHWGLPTSFFTLDPRFCTPRHFKNMRMVFDTTFCGDYATPTFASSCPEAGGMSCKDFVQSKPGEFKEGYWSITRLDVYQRGGSEPLESQPMGPAAPSSSAWAWCLLGLLLTVVAVGGFFVMRVSPAWAKRQITRGLGALQSGTAGSLEQETHGDIPLHSGSLQRPGSLQYAEQAAPVHSQTASFPPSPQRSGFLGVGRWNWPMQPQQPALQRRISDPQAPTLQRTSRISNPPEPNAQAFWNWPQQPQLTSQLTSQRSSRISDPPAPSTPNKGMFGNAQGFWRGMVGQSSPGPGQQQPEPTASGRGLVYNTAAAPSFYGPAAGAGAGAGSWGSFLVNGVGGIVQAAAGGSQDQQNLGGAYGGSAYRYSSLSQPSVSRGHTGLSSSQGYTLPPTINALQPGINAPVGYNPAQSPRFT